MSESPNPDSRIETKRITTAISIVTWNNAAEIADCLAPLGSLGDNWEVWVVDNNSADATVEIVRRDFPNVKLIANPDNKGFAEANNQVVYATDTDFVLFLNPDTRAGADELEKSVEIARGDARIGILGVRLENTDGSLQTTCFHFPSLFKNFIDGFNLFNILGAKRSEELFAGEFFAHDRERNVDWVKGAFMLTRREAIEKAGAIPEDYFMFAEDLDFCRIVHDAGFDVRFTADVKIEHASNKSAGQLPTQWRIERTTLSKYLFCKKCYGGFVARLIQLTDLTSVNYKIIRQTLREPNAPAIAEWQMFRREIFRSLGLSWKSIRERLQQR